MRNKSPNRTRFSHFWWNATVIVYLIKKVLMYNVRLNKTAEFISFFGKKQNFPQLYVSLFSQTHPILVVFYGSNKNGLFWNRGQKRNDLKNISKRLLIYLQKNFYLCYYLHMKLLRKGVFGKTFLSKSNVWCISS